MNNTKENKEWTYKEVEFDRGYAQSVYDPNGNVAIEEIVTSEAELICEKFNRLAAIEQAASNGGVEKFLKDTEDVLIQCLPHGIDLDEEQLETLVRFVNSQCKEAISIALAEKQKQIEELLKDKSMVFNDYPLKEFVSMDNALQAIAIAVAEKQKQVDELREVNAAHVFTLKGFQAALTADADKIEELKAENEIKISATIEGSTSFCKALEAEGNEFAEWCSVSSWKFYNLTDRNIWVYGHEELTTSELRDIFRDWKAKQKGEAT